MTPSTNAEQIVRFVAVRCGIAHQRSMKIEEQARTNPRVDAGASAGAVRARLRALELVLAACIRETGVVRLPPVAESTVGAPRSTPDPHAIRGRWTAPQG